MQASARAPRVYQHIVADIERAIYEGRIASGDKLPSERELVRRLGASRVAVREALRALEHRGLLDVRQGAAGGYFVRALDPGIVSRDFQTLLRLGRLTADQLMEARALIEPEVARLAAERASDLDAKALRASLEERAAVVEAGGEPRDLDVAFHRRLADVARNPIHAVAIEALLDLEVELVAPAALADADRVEVQVAHEALLGAVEARDGERARAAMRGHIVDVQRRIARTPGP
jgi:GntR family transcriptional repressor for pyruvate dehydrogenase complex